MKTLRDNLRRTRDEDGAALVEFAVVAILLFTILFGIIEYGFVFATNLDTRHGAREAARLAAVNFGTNQEIADETCARMDFADAVTFNFTDGGTVGSAGTVEIVVPYSSLVNFAFIPVPTDLASDIEIRLEQDSTNWGTLAGVTCIP